MSHTVDPTLDPILRSWVESTNRTGADFPIQNLPFGAFRRPGEETSRLGVAIGDRVLDLHAAVASGLMAGLAPAIRDALLAPVLNPLLALGHEAWPPVRRAASDLLRADAPTRPDPDMVPDAAGVQMVLPCHVGDFTDFYASIHHATNVGSMFRPDQPLLPNYKHVPIGYHGRASSCVVSGTPVVRPQGQLKDDQQERPGFGPSRLLDYECEVGLVIGAGNPLGSPVPIARAARQIFGYCLVNDWSARDIQKWEYQPLGPFLSKSFATTVAPWIVTAAALEPFRVPAAARSAGDPEPLPYLQDPADQADGAVDLMLEVWLESAAMRAAGQGPVRLSRAAFRDMYWTPAQLVAHHASNGCNLRPGDLLASGTVSGSAEDARGCLLELTWRGTRPLSLPGGETRRFLEDGDEVVLRGRCERAGAVGIGFGECRGRVTG